MPPSIQVLLNLLAQFTGGRGGIDHVIVQFALAAIFYAILLATAWAKYRSGSQERERLLIWGFGFGLARETLMIALATLHALGIVSKERLHIFFPPLEHALHNVGLILIAGAFVRFLAYDTAITWRYLRFSLGSTALAYLSTAWFWADYIQANPASKFGQFWADWVFHINTSVWLLLPLFYLTLHTRGATRNIVVVACALFFLSVALKLPDLALNEEYENVFTPISRACYLIAIPMLGYIYVHEQKLEMDRLLNQLEDAVAARTQELAVAMAEISSTNAKLREQTFTDPLTGLRNRRYFDEILPREWALARRDQRPISLLLIDVDRFKAINDTCGHPAGDEWLRTIAGELQRCARRPTDFAMRIGGDEFAMLLADTDTAGAAYLADTLRAAVEQCSPAWSRISLQGTVTIGVATALPQAGDDAHDWINVRADRALYGAKMSGRNRVCIAAETGLSRSQPSSIAETQANR